MGDQEVVLRANPNRHGLRREAERHAAFARTNCSGIRLRFARTKAVSRLRLATAVHNTDSGRRFARGGYKSAKRRVPGLSAGKTVYGPRKRVGKSTSAFALPLPVP